MRPSYPVLSVLFSAYIILYDIPVRAFCTMHFGVCESSTPKRAVRLAYLFGDGCACSHMQFDDSMSDASLTRNATAANLTRWQDHEEAPVVATEPAAPAAPLVTPSKLSSQRALSV